MQVLGILELENNFLKRQIVTHQQLKLVWRLFMYPKDLCKDTYIPIEPLNISIKADYFDGVLLSASYPDGDVESYSFQCDKSGIENVVKPKMFNPDTGDWVTISLVSIDINQLSFFNNDEQYLLITSSSNSEDICEFIHWAGIHLNIESFLFFFNTPKWIKKDYPRAYVLLLWEYRFNLSQEQFLQPITKTLIEQVTGKKYSKSQFKTLRKFSNNNTDYWILIEAVKNILFNFDSISPFIRHKKNVTADYINQLTLFLRGNLFFKHIPWLEEEVYMGNSDDVAEVFLPLIKDTFFKGIEFQKVKSIPQFAENYASTTRKLFQHHILWVQDYDNNYQLLLSEKWSDEETFPEYNFTENYYFKIIRSAGELRKVGKELNNCVAKYVDETVQGVKSFILYSDEAHHEKALLEICISSNFKKHMAITQFLGADNQDVTETALQKLDKWIEKQNISFEIKL